MLTMQIRRVRIFSLVGTGTLMAGVLGLLVGTVNAILFAQGIERIPGGPAHLPSFNREGGLFSDTVAESALALFVFTMVAWLLGGLIGGALLGVLYNFAAYFTGGIAVVPEIVVAVTRKGERHASISYDDYIRQSLVPALPEGEDLVAGSAKDEPIAELRTGDEMTRKPSMN